jgi:ATP-dependent protease Clp ATPase subunit
MCILTPDSWGSRDRVILLQLCMQCCSCNFTLNAHLPACRFCPCHILLFPAGIPVNRLQQTEREKLLSLRDELHRRVVGQDAAVDVVAAAVLRSRAGLASRSRGSSFLFLGPTGVGKTELAKALAQLLFDDERMMVSEGAAVLCRAWTAVDGCCN